MASATATLVQSKEAGSLVLAASGEWLVGTAADLDRRLRGIEAPKGGRVLLDLTGIVRLDTAGAWLLLRTEHDLSERGNAVEMRNLRPSFEPLIDQVRAAGIVAPARHLRPAHHTIAGFIAHIGEVSLGLITRAYSILGFFGLVSTTAVRLARYPRRLPVTAIVAQMEQTGVNALPIVGLLTFLIGVVIAYQGADYLRFYGLESYTVQLTGASILRELGVLLTAIIRDAHHRPRPGGGAGASATIRTDADLADADPLRQFYGNFWWWSNGLEPARHRYSGIFEPFVHNRSMELLDRNDQVAVLRRHHRFDWLLRGISGGGQRGKRGPAHDAVSG